ncbi:MAG: 3'-5' exonuclease domain-containing protein 2 [Spirochaetes bacterium]|nr:3'-5' exonuclease domain-containing protein 2 [Spirochaetota bacterium]
MEDFKYFITKEDINEKELGKFEGCVEIINDAENARKAVDYLKNFSAVGFDTESRPSFRKGEHHPVSLIQISTEDRAFLFRCNQLENCSILNEIIGSDEIIKIGLGLLRDISELLSDFGFQCRNFIDLEKIAQNKKFQQRGVRALAAYFLNIRISKGAQKTNWERAELTEQQINYAATDAWVCLMIYKKMLEDDFITEPIEDYFIDRAEKVKSEY